MLLVCFRISTFSYLGLRKSSFGFLCGLFFLFQKTIHSLRVSSVILSYSNELFGVVRLYSTVLFVPSGFSDRCFETAPDLSFSNHTKTVLAKW
ncbi:hypothetical protein EM47_022580 [Vibrio parahaemolyticus]|nr:hypothetical protein EM47_022580 [Vibrio parahaemolyticus]